MSVQYCRTLKSDFLHITNAKSQTVSQIACITTNAWVCAKFQIKWLKTLSLPRQALKNFYTQKVIYIKSMLAVAANCRLNRYYPSFLPTLFLSPYLAHATTAALQSSQLTHTHSKRKTEQQLDYVRCGLRTVLGCYCTVLQNEDTDTGFYGCFLFATGRGEHKPVGFIYIKRLSVSLRGAGSIKSDTSCSIETQLKYRFLLNYLLKTVTVSVRNSIYQLGIQYPVKHFSCFYTVWRRLNHSVNVFKDQDFEDSGIWSVSFLKDYF